MENLKSKNVRKRLIAFVLSSLFIMQQSFAYQVMATTITNADNTAIPGNNGTWNITPDAVNDSTRTGFKEFGQIDLSNGDILNFIYTYLPQRGVSIKYNEANGNNDTNVVLTSNKTIDTFINLVNSGVNIQGVVNALEAAGGALKTNGNLMFVTPNGFVVGSSGVINVGNLSVITPTQDSYNNLKNYLDLPTSQPKVITGVTHIENNPVTPNEVKELSFTYGSTPVANSTDKTFDYNTLTAGNNQTLSIGTGEITNNGQIAARGNVELRGGTIAVGDGAANHGIVLANLGNGETTVLNSHDAAATLFNKLVNTQGIDSANGYFSNEADGKITITSTVKTDTAANSIIRNHSLDGITEITNTGNGGVAIAGEISNKNGDMIIKQENTSAKLSLANTGVINSKNTATSGIEGLLIQNKGSQGMDIRGVVNVDHAQKANSVNFKNYNSDMKMGDTANVNNGSNIN